MCIWHFFGACWSYPEWRRRWRPKGKVKYFLYANLLLKSYLVIYHPNWRLVLWFTVALICIFGAGLNVTFGCLIALNLFEWRNRDLGVRSEFSLLLPTRFTWVLRDQGSIPSIHEFFHLEKCLRQRTVDDYWDDKIWNLPTQLAYITVTWILVCQVGGRGRLPLWRARRFRVCGWVVAQWSMDVCFSQLWWASGY